MASSIYGRGRFKIKSPEALGHHGGWGGGWGWRGYSPGWAMSPAWDYGPSVVIVEAEAPAKVVTSAPTAKVATAAKAVSSTPLLIAGAVILGLLLLY